MLRNQITSILVCFFLAFGAPRAKAQENGAAQEPSAEARASDAAAVTPTPTPPSSLDSLLIARNIEVAECRALSRRINIQNETLQNEVCSSRPVEGEDEAAFRLRGQRLGQRFHLAAILLLDQQHLEVLDVESGRVFEGRIGIDQSDEELGRFVRRRVRASVRSEIARSLSPVSPAVAQSPTTQRATPSNPAQENDAPKPWIDDAWPYLVVGALAVAAGVFIAVQASQSSDGPPPAIRVTPVAISSPFVLYF